MPLSVCVHLSVSAWRREPLAVWLMVCFGPISWNLCLQFSCVWWLPDVLQAVESGQAWARLQVKATEWLAVTAHCRVLAQAHFFSLAAFQFPRRRPCCGLCSRPLGVHCCPCRLPRRWGSVCPTSLPSHFASESQAWSGGEDSKWDSIPPLRELPAT